MAPVPQRTHLGRRRFLAGSAALALTGCRFGFPEEVASSGQEAFAPPGESAWRHLAANLSGPLLRPHDFDFAKFNAPYNLRYARTRPHGIALCATSKDVATAILWCRELRVPFAARSGGHSYAGYSTTRGLLIDLSMMRSAHFDPSTGGVRIGGGARNQDLYDTLERANAAITHGRCPSVGAAGFLLGGGIGFNMREHGLACDQLVASEMVTADGKIVALGATDNPDLLWACRGGGGGNFGINTAFTLQAFPAQPLTVFKLRWTARSPAPESVFAALMPALDRAPDGFGSRVSLGAATPAERSAGKDVTISLIGQLTGNRKALDEILAAAYAVGRPQHIDIRETGYWQGQKFLEENDPPGYFQERSTFLVRPLSAQALGVAFEWLRHWPGTGAAADLRFFQTGGRINAVAPTATAFVHRDSRWIMDVGLNWTAADSPIVLRRNREWQDAFYQAMLPFSTRGAYQNFVDPSLENWQQAYYGSNLARLRRIKSRVDPGGVFRFAQGIQPA
ncbi:MAG: FAD-binding oxidoreductase [Betaproteobacteria bacterium]|nr:FAD-binding oxidoreductase [Betaproteobacteria bacterium]